MWGKKACCAVRVVPSGFCPNASATPLTAGGHGNGTEKSRSKAESKTATVGVCPPVRGAYGNSDPAPAVSGVAGGAA